MLNQTKYDSIAIIESSLTEQSMMIDCPDREEKTAILQSYSIDRADEILASYRDRIDRLISIQHPNIQSIVDVFVEDNNLHLVTEAVKGKPAATQVPLSAERCEKFLKDILPALTYLHNRGIIHGNISPQTILFQDKNQPILTDFQAISELKIAAGGEVPPSMIQQLTEIPVANIPSGQQFDLYSLGVTIIYLLSNRELKYLYDPTSQKWQWENYLHASSGKLTRAIDRLLNYPTTTAEVFQEFQTQSRVILDAPIQDSSHDRSSQTAPTLIQNPSDYTFAQTPLPNTSNPTTILSPPPTNFQQTSTTTTPPPADNKLQTLLMGAGIGALMLFVGMSLRGENPKPSPPISQTPSPNPVPSPTIENSPKPSSIPSLSANDATNLISQWLEAKKSIFGSSYRKSAGEDLTTGLAYQRNITDNSGTENSSVDDLAKDGLFYTFGNQEIHQIAEIRSIGFEEVRVTAIVSEQRTLHNMQTGKTKDFSTNRSKSCYEFTKVGDRWKISKTPELFTFCR